MTERNLQSLIRLALGKRKDLKLFRNTCGAGFVGQLVRWTRGSQVTLDAARRTTFGLHPGSGDLIGWKTITVTPDMLGKPLAVFVSVEVKTDTGRLSDEQQNWLEQVNKSGGIAIVARSVADAEV